MADSSSDDEGNFLDRIWFDGGKSLAPYVATDEGTVRRIIELAAPGPEDLLVDLGCGDGRIPLAAAKLRGCRAVGVELEERLVAKFRASIAREGLSDRVTAVEGDIREFDLSPATVIVTYLLPEALALLQPQLVAALRRGVRLVCSTWALPGLRPTLLSEPETGRDVRLYLFTRESVAEGGGAGADDGADAAAPAV